VTLSFIIWDFVSKKLFVLSALSIKIGALMLLKKERVLIIAKPAFIFDAVFADS